MSKIRELAYKIADLLEKNGCEIDVFIYFEDKRLKFDNGTLDDNYNWVDGKNKWIEEDGFDVKKCIEYSNPDTITMTFEGAFYSVINYEDDIPLLQKFEKLIESYGYYYEQGYAWSLALYDI